MYRLFALAFIVLALAAGVAFVSVDRPNAPVVAQR